MIRLLALLTEQASENLKRYKFNHGLKNQDDAINKILEGLYEEEDESKR